MKWRILSLLFIWSLTPCLSAADLVTLNPEEFKAMAAHGALIVDIRSSEEWQKTGTIPGSHLLTFYDANGRYELGKFMSDLAKMAPDSSIPVVLVCRSGNRSEKAGQILASQWPDRRILHLGGGLQRWVMEKQPVVSPASGKS